VVLIQQEYYNIPKHTGTFIFIKHNKIIITVNPVIPLEALNILDSKVPFGPAAEASMLDDLMSGSN